MSKKNLQFDQVAALGTVFTEIRTEIASGKELGEVLAHLAERLPEGECREMAEFFRQQLGSPSALLLETASGMADAYQERLEELTGVPISEFDVS